MNSKREFKERMKMFTENNTEQKLRSLGKRQNEEVKKKDQKLTSIIKGQIEKERMEMLTERMENQRLKSILKRLADDEEEEAKGYYQVADRK